MIYRVSDHVDQRISHLIKYSSVNSVEIFWISTGKFSRSVEKGSSTAFFMSSRRLSTILPIILSCCFAEAKRRENCLSRTVREPGGDLENSFFKISIVDESPDKEAIFLRDACLTVSISSDCSSIELSFSAWIITLSEG